MLTLIPISIADVTGCHNENTSSPRNILQQVDEAAAASSSLFFATEEKR